MRDRADRTLLVTGASGQLGRRVVELLLEAGAGRVIAGTRAPDKAPHLQARGVEMRRVDFDDPDALPAAFAGVDRLLLISTDAVSEPGRRLRQHRSAIAAAVGAGVGHVVYTSFARPEPDSPIVLVTDHRGTEVTLAKSGLRYTALRYSLYAESVLRRLPAMVSEGKLVAARGTGGIAYITREDCARVAAAVLASPSPPTGGVEISGPAVISNEQLASLVSEVTGRPVHFVGLTPEALSHQLVAAGTPPARAASRVSFEVAIAGGYLAFTTGAVEELTARPPTSLRDFLVSSRPEAAGLMNREQITPR